MVYLLLRALVEPQHIFGDFDNGFPVGDGTDIRECLGVGHDPALRHIGLAVGPVSSEQRGRLAFLGAGVFAENPGPYETPPLLEILRTIRSHAGEYRRSRQPVEVDGTNTGDSASGRDAHRSLLIFNDAGREAARVPQASAHQMGGDQAVAAGDVGDGRSGRRRGGASGEGVHGDEQVRSVRNFRSGLSGEVGQVRVMVVAVGCVAARSWSDDVRSDQQDAAQTGREQAKGSGRATPLPRSTGVDTHAVQGRDPMRWGPADDDLEQSPAGAAGGGEPVVDGAQPVVCGIRPLAPADRSRVVEQRQYRWAAGAQRQAGGLPHS